MTQHQDTLMFLVRSPDSVSPLTTNSSSMLVVAESDDIQVMANMGLQKHGRLLPVTREHLDRFVDRYYSVLSKVFDKIPEFDNSWWFPVPQTKEIANYKQICRKVVESKIPFLCVHIFHDSTLDDVLFEFITDNFRYTRI